MNLLSADSLARSVGDKTLFENISFGIQEKDRAAIIGVNGSGKSTLLRILSGRESTDSGQVLRNKECKIFYLTQNPELIEDQTILQNIESSIHKDNPDHAEDQILKVKSILGELGILDLSLKIKTLSGGTKKKISLALCFSSEANLLLLDEPTNHLDLTTILWLEDKLIRTRAAFLLITHDRYFLDRIVSIIYELDGGMFRYEGNYEKYLTIKEEREEIKVKEEGKRKSFLKKELEWLRRQPKARGTKQKARIDRYHEIDSRKEKLEKENYSLSVSGRRLGNKILEIQTISKAYNHNQIILNFSHVFRHQERIGIVGPNGIGKTTLLNLFTGKKIPDKGEVVRGVNTVFGYFDQHSATLDHKARVIDYVKEHGGETIQMSDGTTLTTARMLDRFQFTDRMQYGVIERLSGGEKRRLQLVLELMKNPNFLVLDEPTNDLDIRTLSILEEFLDHFAGCIVVVSHDRYFMDRVADFLFVMKGQGVIEKFPGSYSEFIELENTEEKESAESNQTTSEKKKERTQKKGLSYKENKEMETLEKEIAELEEKKKIAEEILSGKNESTSIQEAARLHAEIEQTLPSKIERWSDLASRI